MKRFLTGIFLIALLTRCTTDGAQVVLQSIKFKPDAITITAGNTMQLTPVFTPSTFSGIAVNWSCSDASTASVSPSGTLYAIKPGIVTVTIKDKNSATAGTCTVTVLY